mmetsp:Transcript_29560/g.52920  ORF Transcript_29560/g.52920 Transcript_29560/m.52920 type:complete len:101 (+) Transcript_29560:269-571(+)
MGRPVGSRMGRNSCETSGQTSGSQQKTTPEGTELHCLRVQSLAMFQSSRQCPSIGRSNLAQLLVVTPERAKFVHRLQLPCLPHRSGRHGGHYPLMIIQNP